MQLGTDTNSMTNYLMGGTVGAPEPKVGMGATILCWTDRHSATIVKVTPCQIHVQRDLVKRIDKNGFSESQSYEFTPDPQATVDVFRKTKKGWRNSSGRSLRVGDRNEYRDPCF